MNSPNSPAAMTYHISDFFHRLAYVLSDLVISKAQNGEAAERQLIVPMSIVHKGKPIAVIWVAV